MYNWTKQIVTIESPNGLEDGNGRGEGNSEKVLLKFYNVFDMEPIEFGHTVNVHSEFGIY